MTTASPTSTFDEIAATGNRGHWHNLRSNNVISCADGTILSVVAGGGCYSYPQVELCFTIDGEHRVLPGHDDSLDCTYPGPYTHVEVLTDDDDLSGPATHVEDTDHRCPVTLPVEQVRAYIIKHGGEKTPTGRTRA